MKKGLLVLIGSIVIHSAAHAQARDNDAVAWVSLAIKKKIFNRLSYRAMIRFRDGNNLSTIQSWYTDVGVYYHFRKTISLSANYVYAPARNRDGYFTTYHQYYISLNNKVPLSRRLSFSNRIIFQHTSSFFLFDQGYKAYARTDIREKVLLNLKLRKRNKIYIGDEVMTTMSEPELSLRRNRLYVGMSQQISSRFSADLFFVLQSTYHRKVNLDQFICGLTFTYKFRKMLDN